MTTERRTTRSEVPDEALCLFFKRLSETGKCETLALADDQGLLIAGTGQNQEDLAATASIAGSDVTSASLDIAGHELVLAWSGQAPPLALARDAVERILVLA